MSTSPENTDLIIGEMRGQLREVVHSVNNLSTKFDALSREVMALATFATELGKLQAKVDLLEQQKHRTEGATGLLGTLLKSPALGWLVGAAITAWALLSGKVGG